VNHLDIQSPQRGHSDSIAITESFIEACKSYNASIVTDALSAWHERRPDFARQAVGAKHQTVKYEALAEGESNVWERIQSLIQRFQSSDLHDTSRIFLHHVLEALMCHFVSSYGVQAMSTSQYRGGSLLGKRAKQESYWRLNWKATLPSGRSQKRVGYP
jgi:hypothetical protein